MYKFRFNLQTGTLKIVEADRFLVLSEASQFHTLGGLGFTLDYTEPSQHWIIFSVYKEKVRIVYKAPQTGSAIYYQRELTRPTSGIVEVEFSEWDRVKKPNHHA